jgi:hypothetical protein
MLKTDFFHGFDMFGSGDSDMARFYMPLLYMEKYDLTKLTHLPVAKPLKPPISSPPHVSHVPLALTSPPANTHTTLAFAPTPRTGAFRSKQHATNIGTQKLGKVARALWRPTLTRRGQTTSAGAYMSGQNPLFSFS